MPNWGPEARTQAARSERRTSKVLEFLKTNRKKGKSQRRSNDQKKVTQRPNGVQRDEETDEIKTDNLTS